MKLGKSLVRPLRESLLGSLYGSLKESLCGSLWDEVAK